MKELVSRSIFMCQNAEYQLHALMLGTPDRLHHGEIELAGAISRMPNVVSRTWEYWSARVGMPAARSAKKTARTAPRARSKAKKRR